MEAPLEFLNGVRDIPTNGYRPRAAEQTQLCHARCKPQAPPKQVKQTLRLGFNFYCQLRCSMELAAISFAPWVGHVVVPDARICGFAYEWACLRGEEECFLMHMCSPNLTIDMVALEGCFET